MGIEAGCVFLCNVRSAGSWYFGRDIKKLDELGLNLQLGPRAWKKRIAPLLDTYARLYPDEVIPHDFVIPSEASWPTI
ncbi:hypothetical protein PC129_g11785 [Phytophthora cactorum]|uniref:Uncharacterized protein n=1 Tax=Phytophthora cactorum TaxID=29920 RepID=A0A8T1KCV6_9STRA|nr:hypothetical protein PC117_g13550 [Phytophthora cactorum]KAG3026152.1 hypothetical protein PC119_g7911 [Phytophthora cactorum]KAG3194288.1 hypothetical protein PC128_g9497 [Phytophthora cactorum]KAG3217387.1 hypothetical protein PC129_g11785 [Phytophthora cactorum]KAG4234904.1 hypothetical protein PC116_g16927 [Phytophthora cactorum]